MSGSNRVVQITYDEKDRCPTVRDAQTGEVIPFVSGKLEFGCKGPPNAEITGYTSRIDATAKCRIYERCPECQKERAKEHEAKLGLMEQAAVKPFHPAQKSEFNFEDVVGLIVLVILAGFAIRLILGC